jgi:hypothetical protein
VKVGERTFCAVFYVAIVVAIGYTVMRCYMLAADWWRG